MANSVGASLPTFGIALGHTHYFPSGSNAGQTWEYLGGKTDDIANWRQVIVAGSDGLIPANKDQPAVSSIPVGGTTGQALVKNSATDRDVTWDTRVPGNVPYLYQDVIANLPATPLQGSIFFERPTVLGFETDFDGYTAANVSATRDNTAGVARTGSYALKFVGAVTGFGGYVYKALSMASNGMTFERWFRLSDTASAIAAGDECPIIGFATTSGVAAWDVCRMSFGNQTGIGSGINVYHTNGATFTQLYAKANMSPNKYYLARIVFNDAANFTATLYDTDGVTILATGTFPFMSATWVGTTRYSIIGCYQMGVAFNMWVDDVVNYGVIG